MRRQGGFALLGFLIITMVAALLVASALRLAGSDLRADLALKARSAVYYESEDSLGRAASWLRGRSPHLASPFRRDRFYSEFSRSAPSFGSNDTSYRVATLVKLRGSSNSAILSNSSELAVSRFAATPHIETGAPLNAVSDFAAAELGGALVRVTLVDALPVDPAKDFGPPPAPAPETDFRPVFRIDVMTATDRGAQLYAYVFGEPRSSTGSSQFESEEDASYGDTCDSYMSSEGIYNSSRRRAGCKIVAGRNLSIERHGIIYGSASARRALSNSGQICADFRSGCRNPGPTCSGGSCAAPALPTYDSWAQLCPSNRGNLTVTGNLTLVPASNTPSERCWNQVTINGGSQLTLTSTTIPYYFRSIRFVQPNRSVLSINPAGRAGKVELYLDGVQSNGFSPRNLENVTGRPGAFTLHYLGNGRLSIDGQGELAMRLYAPDAELELTGRLDFMGAISARALDVTHRVRLHLDEDLAGGGSSSGMSFRLRQSVESYR